MTTNPASPARIDGLALARGDLRALAEQSRAPGEERPHLLGCSLDGADLRGADLGGLKLADGALFRGATISHEQAAQLMAELGLRLG